MPVHEEMLELKIDTKSIAEANKLNRNKHKGRLRTGAAWEGMVALLAEVEETATEQIGVLAETAKIKFADRNEAEFYYNSYINTHRCTWCDKMFKDSRDRCMDHCHTCGLPRAIICQVCNIRDVVPCVNCLL